MAEEQPSPSFAPVDLTDGRSSFDWKSKYPDEAKKQIRWECAYLLALLFGAPVILLLLWLECPRWWFGLSATQYPTFAHYTYAWVGGTLGGTLFDLKWLYHSVAKGMWHVERRLWRMVIPHVSGGLAFAVVLLICSGLFKVFSVGELSRPPVVIITGFMVGYFSDSAIGKLTEVANTLFGSGGKRYPDEDHRRARSTEEHGK
jgi:hypothetical protein